MHINRLLRFSTLLGLAALTGCIGYGYPDGHYPVGVHRGGGYPGYPPPPYGYPGAGRTVRCESDHLRTRHCEIDTRGGVYLSRRLSGSPCIANRTWGYDALGVWVSDGCRAEFTSGGNPYPPGPWPGYGAGPVVRCESINGRWRHCDTAIERGVRVLRNISGVACIRGETWGFDRDGIWVNHGCRADFQVF